MTLPSFVNVASRKKNRRSPIIVSILWVTTLYALTIINGTYAQTINIVVGIYMSLCTLYIKLHIKTIVLTWTKKKKKKTKP